ncbi:MAG: hypothetical protein AAFU77_06605 [Myxococcota bacterium]
MEKIESIELVLVPLVGRFSARKVVEVACVRATGAYPPQPSADVVSIRRQLRLILIGLIGEAATEDVLNPLDERGHN